MLGAQGNFINSEKCNEWSRCQRHSLALVALALALAFPHLPFTSCQKREKRRLGLQSPAARRVYYIKAGEVGTGWSINRLSGIRRENLPNRRHSGIRLMI